MKREGGGEKEVSWLALAVSVLRVALDHSTLLVVACCFLFLYPSCQPFLFIQQEFIASASGDGQVLVWSLTTNLPGTE